MSDPTFADLFSLPVKLELDGKVYDVRPPNQLEQGKFQRWLEERAWQAIDAAPLPPERKAASEAALVAAIAAGEYEWGGSHASKALATQAGMGRVLELILGVDKDTAAKLLDVYYQRIANVLKAASADDPKAVRAALTALGLPSDFLSSGSATRRSGSRGKKSRK